MPTSTLVASDTIILFADLQLGIADLPLTYPAKRLRQGVSALARLAKILGIPVVVSAVPGPDGTAAILPEIDAALGTQPVHYRDTADSLANAAIRSAIEKTGRKSLLISGVATEIAVQLPAVSGAALGLHTYVVVDACGGISARTEDAALRRITQAGGSTISVPTLTGELAGSFASSTGQACVGLLYESVGQLTAA